MIDKNTNQPPGQMVDNEARVFVPLWVCVSVLSAWEFQDNVVGQVIFGISSCLVDHAAY